MRRALEVAHGWGRVDNGKVHVPGLEIGIDLVDVNFVLSAFSACIAKKIATSLSLDWVKVDIISYVDIEDLIKYLDLKIKSLIVEVRLKKKLDQAKVIKAAKECPTISLIEDKIQEIRVLVES